MEEKKPQKKPKRPKKDYVRDPFLETIDDEQDAIRRKTEDANRKYITETQQRIVSGEFSKEYEIAKETFDQASFPEAEKQVDDNGRELYATNKETFFGLSRTWIPVVGIHGESFEVTSDLYKHYDFNLPAGVLSGMDLVKATEFYWNLRRNFLEKYACFLNTLVTKTTYADFKQKSYVTVQRWVKERTVDVIEIDGQQFVFLSVDELDAFNEYLMARTIAMDSPNEQAELERINTVQVWERRHGKKCSILRRDTIGEWLFDENLSIIEHNKKMKITSDAAYTLYKRWCNYASVPPIDTKTSFMKRIRGLGYVDWNDAKHRGFYFYAPENPVMHERKHRKLNKRGELE